MRLDGLDGADAIALSCLRQPTLANVEQPDLFTAAVLGHMTRTREEAA